MLTLSILRTDFKKLLKWGGVAIAILIGLFILFKILIFVKNIIFPPPPPQATAIFGKLQKPDFPKNIEKDFTYEIDTLSGDLPALPYLTKVYKMEQRGPDILAVQNASQRIVKLGFNFRPLQISDYVYKWSDPNPPNRVLIGDIRLNEYNLISSYQNYADEIKKYNFKDESEITDSAYSFLQTVGLSPDDIGLDREKTKIEFSNLNNGVLQSTEKVTNSNIATVYFFQKAINEVPIVYPQGKNSSMKLLVGAGGFKEKVLEANFSHQKILDESATYTIKTAGQAYEELKNKKAFIVNHSGENNHVKIKNVYLALYSAGKLQDFLTPVIVFEGDNNFLAYVPAVTDEWIEN